MEFYSLGLLKVICVKASWVHPLATHCGQYMCAAMFSYFIGFTQLCSIFWNYMLIIISWKDWLWPAFFHGLFESRLGSSGTIGRNGLDNVAMEWIASGLVDDTQCLVLIRVALRIWQRVSDGKSLTRLISLHVGKLMEKNLYIGTCFACLLRL